VYKKKRVCKPGRKEEVEEGGKQKRRGRRGSIGK
jgi:hypothetical protein